jgi:hypothetical protein
VSLSARRSSSATDNSPRWFDAMVALMLSTGWVVIARRLTTTFSGTTNHDPDPAADPQPTRLNIG